MIETEYDYEEKSIQFSLSGKPEFNLAATLTWIEQQQLPMLLITGTKAYYLFGYSPYSSHFYIARKANANQDQQQANLMGIRTRRGSP